MSDTDVTVGLGCIANNTPNASTTGLNDANVIYFEPSKLEKSSSTSTKQLKNYFDNYH